MATDHRSDQTKRRTSLVTWAAGLTSLGGILLLSFGEWIGLDDLDLEAWTSFWLAVACLAAGAVMLASRRTRAIGLGLATGAVLTHLVLFALLLTYLFPELW